jgi:hypothetical protein
VRPASCTPRASKPCPVRGTSNRIPDSSYLRLAAEIGRHQSSRTLGSSCLFSAPSFLAAVFSLSSNPPPPHSPHPPGASSRRLCIARCSILDDVPAFHSRRWTRLPSRLSNFPVCFYPMAPLRFCGTTSRYGYTGLQKVPRLSQPPFRLSANPLSSQPST